MASAEDRVSLLDSDELWQAILADLRWEGADNVALLSFDVFDTVLIRDDISEIRRFWDVAELCAKLTGFDRRDLFLSRLTATRASYRTDLPADGYREGRLEEIHRLTIRAFSGPIGDGVVELMVDAELNYEQARLTLNPLIQKLIDHLEPESIVCASNMYMSSSQVARLLKGAGAPECKVLTSCDQRCSKNNGRLLELARSERQDSNRCLHIGDSYTSDFAPAKRLGWLAMLWPISEPSRARRQKDAISCVSELESVGVALGSLANHFVANP